MGSLPVGCKVRTRQISAKTDRSRKLLCKLIRGAKRGTSCSIIHWFPSFYSPALCWRSMWWHNKNWNWHFLQKSRDATKQGTGGSRQWAYMTGWRCSEGLQKKKTKAVNIMHYWTARLIQQAWAFQLSVVRRGICQHTLLSSKLLQFGQFPGKLL